jgi:hypothetical protein
MSTAQLMLALPGGVRSFCAASVEAGSQTFAEPRRKRDGIRIESPSPAFRRTGLSGNHAVVVGSARGPHSPNQLPRSDQELCFLRSIILLINFCQKKWKDGLTFCSYQVKKEA